MRKLIVFENVTVDGCFSGPHGEYDWARADEKVADASMGGSAGTDLFMFGRTTYEIMAGFWPTDAGKQASPQFANVLNNTPKLVFSKTLKQADWQGTRIFSNIDRHEIERLKAEADGSIMILGSGSIVTQLSELGLVDEYHLVVTPVVLPGGKTLFEGIGRKLDLQLVSSKQFDSGVVLLKYVPA